MYLRKNHDSLHKALLLDTGIGLLPIRPVIEKITDLPVDKYFDINLDNLFLDESIKNIKNEPGRYLVLYIKKFISFLFIDLNSTIKNYYHPLHLIPLIIISFSSFIGMLISIGKSKNLNLIVLKAHHLILLILVL